MWSRRAMAARQAEGTKGGHEVDRLLAPFSTLSPSFVLRGPGRHTSIKIHSCRRSQATCVPAGELSWTPEPDGLFHVDGWCTGPSLPEGAAQHLYCLLAARQMFLYNCNHLLAFKQQHH